MLGCYLPFPDAPKQHKCVMEHLSQVAHREPGHGGRARSSGVQFGGAGTGRDRQGEGKGVGELGSSARGDFPINSCFIVAEGYWPLP